MPRTCPMCKYNLDRVRYMKKTGRGNKFYEEWQCEGCGYTMSFERKGEKK